ncbi:hypothetical protein ACH4S8_37930 [Streptomyces sp. NPDC021080]|uniref:hypothetical protein n=1 Tax=Streptomyces sp. NPDC021080 TaxID=3365110 RepID=UPI00379D30A3
MSNPQPPEPAGIRRTPLRTTVRYGIAGAPLLTAEQLRDGSYGPGTGIEPSVIEIRYSSAREGVEASVSVTVTGSWTSEGEPERPAREVETRFEGDRDQWPRWVRLEVRLSDPACQHLYVPADDFRPGDLIHVGSEEWPVVEARTVTRDQYSSVTVNAGASDQLDGRVWQHAYVTRKTVQARR